MTINELIKEAHENAIAHGWWDKKPTFGDLIALCHSELSEALEAFRGGRQPQDYDYPCTGIPYELADVCIRIFDMCGWYGINLAEIIAEKMEYNKTRPYRHGNKII